MPDVILVSHPARPNSLVPLLYLQEFSVSPLAHAYPTMPWGCNARLRSLAKHFASVMERLQKASRAFRQASRAGGEAFTLGGALGGIGGGSIGSEGKQGMQSSKITHTE
jgi:hypothetical protein